MEVIVVKESEVVFVLEQFLLEKIILERSCSIQNRVGEKKQVLLEEKIKQNRFLAHTHTQTDQDASDKMIK